MIVLFYYLFLVFLDVEPDPFPEVYLSPESGEETGPLLAVSSLASSSPSKSVSPMLAEFCSGVGRI